jgi:hypothetical protein
MGAAQDIYWVQPGDDSQAEPLLADPSHQERDPAVSPNSRWIAYASNESGRLEVYVQPFPNVNGGRWSISANGGNSPQWSREGHELFYRAADGWMMAVGVRDGATFDFDSPRRLFLIPDEITTPGARMVYEVAADGRFVMSRRVDSGGADTRPSFVLVTNFLAELTDRVGRP